MWSETYSAWEEAWFYLIDEVWTSPAVKVML